MRKSLCASLQSAHARSELVEMERLDEIVICTFVQTIDAIGDCITRGCHQHRHAQPSTAERAQNAQTIDTGQRKIKQDQIEIAALGERERRIAITSPLRTVSPAPERCLDTAAEQRIIFDEKYMHRYPGLRDLLRAIANTLREPSGATLRKP
jgi:hypothetical protein